MAVSIEYIVVGGGGAGGGNGGGGGGAGGILSGSASVDFAEGISVTVGNGGTGGIAGTGGDGGTSSLGAIASVSGGGGGGTFGATGRAGASGGGGGSSTGSTVNGGAGTSGQGYAGGFGKGTSGTEFGGGGGGGNTAVGVDSNTSTKAAGNGGAGLASTISGSSVVYGSGGGAGAYAPGGWTAGTGGTNAGNGAATAAAAGTSATANRGGGGGGGAGGNGVGGHGGSGVVIVRYLTSAGSVGSGGSITTSGSYTVHTFTGSGDFAAPGALGTAPTNLASGTPTEEGIPLTWTDPPAESTRILIYRATSDVFASSDLIGAVENGTAAFTAGGLASSTKYYFWAAGMTDTGNVSSPTASVTATTAAQDAGFTTPGTPTSLATTGPTSATIGLTWTDGADTAWIHVYQNTTNNSAGAALVDVALAGAQALTMYGLSSSTAYYFWLKAVSSSGQQSAFSTGTSGTTTSNVSAPTSFSASAIGRNSIRLTWTDGNGTEALLLYRNTADSYAGASVIGSIDAGGQLYTDTGLSSGAAYYYWLLPIGTSGVGTEEGSVTATTYGAAGNPGTDIVSQIVTAAKTRLTAVLSSDFEQLKYVKDLKKNGRTPWGYGVLIGDEEPTEPSVFGSYTAEMALQVVLYRAPNAIQNDRDIETAELALEQWKDRVHREFTTTRLYENDVIVRIGDPDVSIEYLEDSEAVALRLTFPVMYRNSRA